MKILSLGVSGFRLGGGAGFEGSRVQWQRHSHIKRELNQKLSGNEFYYTACSLLVMLKYLCCKLHCQEVFIQTSFHLNSPLQERCQRVEGLELAQILGKVDSRQPGCSNTHGARTLDQQEFISLRVSFYVVLRKPIPTQIRQLIFYITDNEGSVDGFVWELTFAERRHKHVL